MKTTKHSLTRKLLLRGLLLAAAIMLWGHSQYVSAQWSTNGTNVYYNGGNVGIGTDTPMTKLHVVGNIGLSNDAVIISNADWSNYFKPYESATGRMVFRTGGTDRMSILYNGNVGIGTTSPGSRLYVAGGGYGSPGGANQSAYALGAQSIAADASIYSYGAICSGNGYGNCTGSGGVVLGANNTSATVNIPNSGNAFFNGGNFGIGTSTPTQGKFVLSDTTQNAARIVLSGQEFHQASNTSTDGVAFVLGVNRTGNRQLWIADSAALAPNSTNTVLRLFPNGGIDAIAPDGVATKNLFLNPNGGNVGIGTTNPGYKLDVQGGGQINASGGLCIAGDCKTTWSQVGGGGGASSAANVSAGQFGANTGGGDFSFPAHIIQENAKVLQAKNAAGTAEAWMWPRWSDNVMYTNFGAAGWNIRNNSSAHVMFLTNGGNVGIGAIAPNEKLEVSGNIKVTGSGNINAAGTITGGNIVAKYQDLAEWVPTSEQLPAGTVVVLDTTKSNQVIRSTQSYDTRVAGVISAQPGITLGESGEGKVLVATTGRVLVQVDATNGPIHIGDLLVTSDIPGFAMKSTPVNLSGIKLHRPGTIIGKALESVEKGSGRILVLLSLQ